MCRYRVVFHPSVISTLSSRFHSFSFTFSDFSYVEYFQMFSSRRDSNQSINVKWQKALFDGLHDTRAKAWQRTARKRDADPVKEMAGEWILAEPPWWTNFQRPCWQVAMRLRYGLEVNTAIGPNIAPYCLARKMNGTYCLAQCDI